MVFVSNLDLTWTMRGLDALLRRRFGIEELADDPDCVLRITLEPATRAVSLSDGTPVRVGEPTIQIHFWNEHLPTLPPEGLNAAWTSVMKRRIRHSFGLLADCVDREPRFREVAAIVATPTYPRRSGPVPLSRTLRLFGFDVVDRGGAAIHDRLDSLLVLGLNWAFNPVELRRHGLSYGRIEVWMSRGTLLKRYGRKCA